MPSQTPAVTHFPRHLLEGVPQSANHGEQKPHLTPYVDNENNTTLLAVGADSFSNYLQMSVVQVPWCWWGDRMMGKHRSKAGHQQQRLDIKHTKHCYVIVSVWEICGGFVLFDIVAHKQETLYQFIQSFNCMADLCIPQL